MMNNIIKEQLEKCSIAQVPILEGNETEVYIPKVVPEPCPEVNKYYVISIENYILYEPEGFTLSANWNKGTRPVHEYYRVQVVQAMGTMFKVRGVGYNYSSKTDFEDSWEGWLPRKGFHIKEEL